MTPIEVTAEDIANGLPGNCGKCPIALAILRVVKPETVVAVTYTSVYTIDRNPDIFFAVRLPEEAFNFIRAFDRGENPAPLTFPLDIPEQYLRPELVAKAVTA